VPEQPAATASAANASAGAATRRVRVLMV
jgi:hypothetical protein